MTVLHDIPIDSATIANVCRAYGVRRLWLFGSILRDDFRRNSDVDVLVELRQPVGLFRLGELQAAIRDLFGRTVHLTTWGSVPDSVRPGVLRAAKLVYRQTTNTHG
jgi:predicted nucleotidyltransferase